MIPGGVDSAQELRNALEHDPIAASHYTGFDVSQTHVVRLASDGEMYVSYRLNNRIYWTHKRLRLFEGRDGHYRRQERGEDALRKSPFRYGRVPRRDEATARHDTRSRAATRLGRRPADCAADGFTISDFSSLLASGPEGTVAPSVFPIVGGGTESHSSITPPTTPTTPPVATPEPDSFVLTAAGISIVLASGWFGYSVAEFRTRFSVVTQFAGGTAILGGSLPIAWTYAPRQECLGHKRIHFQERYFCVDNSPSWAASIFRITGARSCRSKH